MPSRRTAVLVAVVLALAAPLAGCLGEYDEPGRETSPEAYDTEQREDSGPGGEGFGAEETPGAT